MNFLSTVVKPTWDANSDIAGGFSSFIEGLAGVPATVRHLTALNAKHGHVTLKTDVVFVWAVDLCVVFEPTDRHGLRAGDSALNLHQFTLHVLNVLWGLFGEHWRVFTLWKQEKTVMWAEEVWFFFHTKKQPQSELECPRWGVCGPGWNTFDSDIRGTRVLPHVIRGMAKIFPSVGFICLQNGQVGRVFHTADLIIAPSANIFMVFGPCDFYRGRAGHVTL